MPVASPVPSASSSPSATLGVLFGAASDADPSSSPARSGGGADGAVPEDRVSIGEAGAGGPDPGGNGTSRLDAQDRALLRELQSSDARVRAHEAAHQAAGGGLTGGASFTYRQGPDGRQYAVGGEVPIRMGGDGDSPDQQIELARRIRAAALAPADPSAQDLAVAAAATQMEAMARARKAQLAAQAYRAGASGAGAGAPIATG